MKEAKQDTGLTPDTIKYLARRHNLDVWVNPAGQEPYSLLGKVQANTTYDKIRRALLEKDKEIWRKLIK